ncbi:10504_t:CDS:2 [Acaulospora morrowiae]|uniref:10504_t:CDS:1 n=1 Tax=Acaulospora morrowiae TaxID=94023 RepID=A0A9N9GJP7_9GLOM|nr:10504_t:CDS:2 [Acaulospora morrowiae]
MKITVTLLILIFFLFGIVLAESDKQPNVTQEQICKGLRVVYPARPGITYSINQSHTIKIRRDPIFSNIQYIRWIQLWGTDITTGRHFFVKTLWEGRQNVAPGSDVRIRVRLNISKNFVTKNHQFYYRIYSKTTEGFAECYIKSGTFYIQS